MSIEDRITEILDQHRSAGGGSMSLRDRIARFFHRIGHWVSPPEVHEYRVSLDGEEVFSVIFEGGFVAWGDESRVTIQLFCNEEEVVFDDPA